MFEKMKSFRAYMKHGEGLQAALPPLEAVVVDAPTPVQEAAVEAALGGDHRPAADLLERTRSHRDWDAHSAALTVLGDAASSAPQWLEDWQREEPESPAAALVRARLGLVEAWHQRSNAQSQDVSREQFEAFHATLADATALIQRAADLAPDDPEPWNLALTHARGLEAPREYVEEYLGNLRSADAWHYWGHRAALEYLTDKWFGSHEESHSFARSVVEAAPADARVQTLALDALLEHLVSKDGDAAVADRERAVFAVDRARAWVDAHDGDDRTWLHRNALAFCLYRLGRFREAYDELVAVGPHVTGYPWGYFGDDARSTYKTMCTAIVTKAAEEGPAR